MSIALSSDPVVLERGELRVEIVLQPFSLTVRRRGRRLLRAAGAWVAQGTVHDHFIQFTEGVVAREELAPPERALLEMSSLPAPYRETTANRAYCVRALGADAPARVTATGNLPSVISAVSPGKRPSSSPRPGL